MASTQGEYRPDVAIPPGWTLRETLEGVGMSQAELARRADRPEKTISEIITGKTAITPETALDLERVLRVPARFWNNLERNYRETLARLKFKQTLAQEAKRLPAFPYREMARLGWVKKTQEKPERVAELLRFFGESSLANVRVRGASLRTGKGRKISQQALAAWVRKGEIEAQRIHTSPYTPDGFREALGKIRLLTRESIATSQHELRKTCASIGVAVVFVPHLPNTYANGVTKWLRPTKALIQLSLRYSYDDIFWFSFFHEAGHILKHGKRFVFIEQSGMEKTAEEREADQFAENTLIPEAQYQAFIRSADILFSEKRVRRFAETIGVAPSIIVGRLQNDQLLKRTHLNGVRTKFRWAEN